MHKETYTSQYLDGTVKHETVLLPNDYAYFFGYAGGLMYSAFDAWEFNAGVSGNGGEKEIDCQEMKSGCECAIHNFDNMNYPDITRADEVKAFYERHRNDAESTKYVIRFS